jgi:hypothetical protein
MREREHRSYVLATATGVGAFAGVSSGMRAGHGLGIAGGLDMPRSPAAGLGRLIHTQRSHSSIETIGSQRGFASHVACRNDSRKGHAAGAQAER